MATTAFDPDTKASELDLRAMLAVLWRHKFAALLFVALGLAGAVAYLHQATYKYLASAIITPAEQTSTLSTDGLSNLSAVIGLELSPQSGSGFALFREAAESYPVAEVLSRDPRIMRTLFSHLWDDDAGVWREPQSLGRSVRKAVGGLIGVPQNPWSPPSAADLRNLLRSSVSIAPDRRRALTIIQYQHADPEFARYLVSRVIDESDRYLRAKSLARSSEYIAYLEKRLAEVAIAEQRSAIASALSSYEMMRMMASSTVPFTAETFGEVTVSTAPVSPRPIVVIAIGLVAGLLVWGAYVGLREWLMPLLARDKPSAMAD
ncbi:Wzz/FepE/Etk N-terminal domain-containing protein [Thermaurantiacus sp.]